MSSLVAMAAGEVAAFCSLAFAVLMVLLTAAIIWGKTTQKLASMSERLVRIEADVDSAKRKARRALSRSVHQARVITRLARRMRMPVDEKALIGRSEKTGRARCAETDGAGCTQQRNDGTSDKRTG